MSKRPIMQKLNFVDIQLFHMDHAHHCHRNKQPAKDLKTFIQDNYPEFEQEYREFELSTEKWLA